MSENRGSTINAILRRARFAVSLAVRNPRLLEDYARWFVAGHRHRPTPTNHEVHAGVLSYDEGIAFIQAEFGSWDVGPSFARVSESSFEADARIGGGAVMAGDSLLGRLVYDVARATRPDIVIETGVATGVTSAHLLAALEDNGHGALHSIDLPPTDMIVADHVGIAIPESLRHRWTYHWGTSRRLLPKLLNELHGSLMFVHDSDHSYTNMAWEIRTAWMAMSSGGVIVCDDVHLHTAFLDVAGELNGKACLVEQAEKGGTTGLLIRPAVPPADHDLHDIVLPDRTPSPQGT